MAIGDVVGRGFHAAAIMGQLRSGLRAYSLDGIAPGEVLERLSRLLRQLEPGRTATVTYLVLDPHGGGLSVASAGHPPPLVQAPGEEPRLLELPGSVPLGATRHVRYDSHDLELEPGSVLLLYTDGLVERSDEKLETGLERLIATVRDNEDDLEHLGDRLVDVLLPEGPGTDDAALIMARAMPLADTLLARFPAEVESIPGLRRLLGRWLGEQGATRRDVDDLTLAAAEAAANAIEHAYGLAAGIVELHATTVREAVVSVEISDFGNWRAPRGTHRGRGLLLMEGLTDEVEVIRTGQGTTVELTRRIGTEEAA
jgi:anti-sigma regulatory factor (Ser/Thr protein kinase)